MINPFLEDYYILQVAIFILMPNMNSFTPKYRSCVFMAFFGFDHLQSQVCKISKTFDISSFPFNTIADTDFHFFFTRYKTVFVHQLEMYKSWCVYDLTVTQRTLYFTRDGDQSNQICAIYRGPFKDCIGEVVRKNSLHIKNKIN